MSSINVPSGMRVELINDVDYVDAIVVAEIDTSFSCIGATKYNKANLL